MKHLKEISQCASALVLVSVAFTLLYFNRHDPYVSIFAYGLLVLALFKT